MAMIAVQMRRRRDSDGVDALAQQLIGIVEHSATEIAGDSSRRLRSGSATPTSFTPGNSDKHPRMITAHHAYADNADTQRRSRTQFLCLTHDQAPSSTQSQPHGFPVARPMPTGDGNAAKSEHELIQSLTSGLVNEFIEDFQLFMSQLPAMRGRPGPAQPCHSCGGHERR